MNKYIPGGRKNRPLPGTEKWMDEMNPGRPGDKTRRHGPEPAGPKKEREEDKEEDQEEEETSES